MMGQSRSYYFSLIRFSWEEDDLEVELLAIFSKLRVLLLSIQQSTIVCFQIMSVAVRIIIDSLIWIVRSFAYCRHRLTDVVTLYQERLVSACEADQTNDQPLQLFGIALFRTFMIEFLAGCRLMYRLSTFVHLSIAMELGTLSIPEPMRSEYKASMASSLFYGSLSALVSVNVYTTTLKAGLLMQSDRSSSDLSNGSALAN